MGSLQHSPIPLVGQEGCLLPHPSQGGNANSGLHLLRDIIIIWLHHVLFAFVTAAVPSCLGDGATYQTIRGMKLRPFHLLGDAATVQTSCLEMGLLSRFNILLKDEGTDHTSHSILLGDAATVQISCLEMGLTVQTC